MSETVSVHFIEQGSGYIFQSIHIRQYPNYNKGDCIWIERDTSKNTPFKDVSDMRLTKFEIMDIQHRAAVYYSSQEIATSLSMEVILRKVDAR